MKKVTKNTIIDKTGKIVLLTKDALRADYLTQYGNLYNNTPNIDALAEKGTIFRRHYTAAPSSAMSYTSMFSGLYPHELKRKTYSEVNQFDESETLFDVMENNKFKCHIVWDAVWFKTAYRHSKVYGKDATYHNLDIQKGVGPHIKYLDSSPKDKKIARQNIVSTLKAIDEEENKYFVWIHLPHVLSGHTGYGSDIEMFDKIVGDVRAIVGDNAIYISSDHGHMNMQKGIPVYGHHLYEGAIKIPLIVPRIGGLKEITYPTSNTQLTKIITEKIVEERKFVYSDTQYYQQSNRKMAIICKNFKYIYNKKTKKEELYDLVYDHNECVNLLSEFVYDRNRKVCYRIKEIYYYPKFAEIAEILSKFRDARLQIWREGNFFVEKMYKANNFRRNFWKYLLVFLEQQKAGRGKWNAKVKNTKYFP